MVQKTNKNISIIQKFIKKLKKTMSIEKFILFGSRAKGTFNSRSDFDVMIVSDDFKDILWYKRPVNMQLKWKEDYPLEILAYTPEEFEKKKNQIGIVQQAVKEGIEI